MNSRTGTPTRIVLSLTTIVLLTGAASRVAAQQQSTEQKAASSAETKEHVVRKGDTLWGLAGFYFTNPLLWPTIFEANRDVVEDPHWIYPDERLRIPGIESGLTVAVEPQSETGSGPEAGMPRSGYTGPTERTRFYTVAPPPDANRESDLYNSRQPLLPVSPAEFHSAAWLDNARELGVRGRLLGLADPTSQNDRLTQFMHPFDRILFSDLAGGELVVGDTMMVVRVAPPVPGYGDLILPVALVHIDSLSERVASASIVRQYGAARPGDHLIPMLNLPPMERVSPQPVSDGPEGRLVAFIEREQLYGTMDNGFIDLGEADGVQVGDEFIAFVPTRSQAQGKMPEEQVARLTVVKVMPNTSTVRVADASNTALQPGLRVRLVRKMP